MRELYQILQVSRRASAADVKKAYYARAHSTHPDKWAAAHPPAHLDAPAWQAAQQEATRAFREAAFAYEILREPELRAMYDRFGMLGVHALRGTLPRGPGDLGPRLERVARFLQAATRGLRTRLERAQQQQAEQLRARRARQRGQQRGQDLAAPLPVQPEVLWQGGTVQVAASRPVACAACRGTGCLHGHRPPACTRCTGSGELVLELAGLRLVAPCPHCLGLGAGKAEPCPACAGRGKLLRAGQLSVQVHARHSPELPLRLPGYGTPGPLGGPAGDLVLTPQLPPPPATPATAPYAVGTAYYQPVQLAPAQTQEGHVLQIDSLLDGGALVLTVPRGGAQDIVRTVVVPGRGLPDAQGARGPGHFILLPPPRSSAAKVR